jgi:DNA polymerase III epsilon subunit-like protein
MRQVFLDTETTGIEIGACVIELAAIMVEDGEIVDTFHEFAKPYRPINPQAQRAHGISMSMLETKPEEKIMLKNFM